MFHERNELTIGRIQAFLNRKDMLKTLLYREVIPVTKLSRHRNVMETPLGFAAATSDASRFIDITTTPLTDVKLSPPWSTHWFRVEIGRIPACPAGSEVHFRWDSGCEAMLWNTKGEPIDSFTGTTDETLRDTHVIRGTPTLPIVVFVEVSCNEMFGLSADWVCGPAAPVTAKEFTLKRCEVAVYDTEVAALVHDLAVLLDIVKTVPETSQVFASALRAADEAINTCVIGRPETVAVARKITARCFGERRVPMGERQLPEHSVIAVGNCHIDTAWLWRYRETRRKTARSWSAQLRLSEQFPDFRFAFSQAQQMEWLKEDFPTLFAEVKRAVAEGRFVPVGATWVEMDCNMPSGESLVRQFMFGQRFFVREFGKPCDIFWLPDTFGYSAQLPQVMRLAGVPHFLTQKLSWNQFNKFPHTTFMWEGLDGTTVVTHFPPAETYTGRVDCAQTLKSETNNRDKDRCPASLMLFGHGDGGGGPQAVMIERLRRLASVPSLPAIRHGTPAEFFGICDEDAKKLQTWKGELYFELHRGTYTTQARNKLSNRRAEVMLHDVECAAALAGILCRQQSFAYPSDELDRLWKLVLLNQFHDVIPGSSIEAVYRDSAEQYADIQKSAANILGRASVALARTFLAPGTAIVNTLEWERSTVVELAEAAESPEQVSPDGVPLVQVRAPGIGIASVSEAVVRGGAPSVAGMVNEGKHVVLENEFLLARFCVADGTLVSLIHKPTLREAICPGTAGNRFVVFEDIPNYWDAWDVDIFHLEKVLGLPDFKCTAEVREKGPIRSRVDFKIKLTGRCTIEQTVTLARSSKRLDFGIRVQWSESHKFLKVEFPLNVRSLSATFETQFGHVERPTHMNTSWDMARFEVCGHRWADLSEYGFGVSLLNDCKYGHSVLGSVMRLSLLRSPKAPDANADMGTHDISYSLFPHSGTFQEAGTIREASDLNDPMIVIPNPEGRSAFPKPQPFLTIKGGHGGVAIEAVKLDEEVHSNIVVRMCERFGGSCTARLTSLLPVKSAGVVNILEQRMTDQCTWTSDGVQIQFKPFQIITVKLLL